MKATILSRAGGRCEARYACCGHTVDHLHHRLRRSQGGKETVANLLAVCWACHEHIHRNPEDAYQRRFLLRQPEQGES